MKRPMHMTRQELEEEVTWCRSRLALTENHDSTEVAVLRRQYGWRPSTARLALQLYVVDGRWLRAVDLDSTVRSWREANGVDPVNLVRVHISFIRKGLGREAIESDYVGSYRMTPIGLAAVKEHL